MTLTCIGCTIDTPPEPTETPPPTATPEATAGPIWIPDAVLTGAHGEFGTVDVDYTHEYEDLGITVTIQKATTHWVPATVWQTSHATPPQERMVGIRIKVDTSIASTGRAGRDLIGPGADSFALIAPQDRSPVTRIAHCWGLGEETKRVRDTTLTAIGGDVAYPHRRRFIPNDEAAVAEGWIICKTFPDTDQFFLDHDRYIIRYVSTQGPYIVVGVEP